MIALLALLLTPQNLTPAACSQGAALVIHKDGKPARIVQSFECDTTRDKARLIAWTLHDGTRVWNTAADAQTLSFGRKLHGLGDLDADGWQDLAVISLDASSQERVIALRDGARGETMRMVRCEPDERDFAGSVLPIRDRDGDGVADWVASVCVQDPTQRAQYAALIVYSGKSGERLGRLISSQRANSLQGFAVSNGARWVWLLAGRSVQAFDLDSGVVAKSWQSEDAAVPVRLVRAASGALALIESPPSGGLRLRELDATSLKSERTLDLAGVRPVQDLVQVVDRNADGVEDWLALHNGSAEGLGTWLSGKDWSVLGQLRPDGIATHFQTREVHRIEGQGFLITNHNTRPQEKERGAYWFSADGALRRVFAGS